MAREMNAELLDVKIEKAQQDLVKAKHRYDEVAANLKDLLDKIFVQIKNRKIERMF